MPLVIACPSCGGRLQVPDSMAGKKGKCPGCGKVLLIPGKEPAGKRSPAPAGRPARSDEDPPRRPRREEVDELEEVDDLEEVDEEPRPRRRREEPDDEAITDSPRRKAPVGADEAPRPRRRRRDEDEDLVEDEEPVRRPRRKKQGGSKGRLGLLLGLGAVLLLTCLGGGGGLAWYFWRSRSGPASDLTYLPANSQMVASLKVQELLNSKVYRDIKNEFPQLGQLTAGLDQLEKEIGLPLGDIDTVLIGSNMNSMGGRNEGVFIVRTLKEVKASDLLGRMKESGFTESKVGRYTLHEKGTHAFCVLEPKRVLYGEPAPVKSVLQRNKQPDLPPELAAALKDTDFTQTVALAMSIKALPNQPRPGMGAGGFPGLPVNPQAQFKDVEAMSLQASVGADIAWRVSLHFKDAKGASDAKTKAETDLQTLKQFPGLPAAAVELMNTITFQVKGSRLENTGRIDVGKILTMAKGFQPPKF